jgi:hypothetical protein
MKKQPKPVRSAKRRVKKYEDGGLIESDVDTNTDTEEDTTEADDAKAAADTERKAKFEKLKAVSKMGDSFGGGERRRFTDVPLPTPFKTGY